MSADQLKVNEFLKDYKISTPLQSRILDLASEMGECCKLAFNESISSEKGKDFQLEKWKEELGDCLFSLLTCFESLGINSSESLDAVLAKYKKRFNEKGKIDSGHL